MRKSIGFVAVLLFLGFGFTHCASQAPMEAEAKGAEQKAQIMRMNASNTDPDFVPMVAQQLPPSGGSKILTLMTWNVKHLGRNGFASGHASPLLAGVDVIAFQEVNFSSKKTKNKQTGLDALVEIAERLQALTKEKICVAISAKPTDGLEAYGYIWRDARVAYIKTSGEIQEHCPESTNTIRLGVKQAARIQREPAFGTFYFKPAAKQFVYATIHLLPAGKKPQDEIEPLFSTFASVQFPIVLAGDFNLDADHRAFGAAHQVGFRPAMINVLTSLKRDKRELSKAYDNFWFRNIRMIGAPKVFNLYQIFPEMNQKDVYNNLSDHSPVAAQFEFVN